ncbi:YgaB family protein [Bacillus sp. 165]|uniref:YgaB family protein n=1 Tax=Bacillus sp. 165 TaxID=1529117 RepID=UPI001ADD3E97|nr:hypothetical protein [Bacillus sp. 165]
MKQFNDLVTEQMKIMDQLLYLQGEAERCEEIKATLSEFQDEAKIRRLEEEMHKIQQQLKHIQETFEKQTLEVIQSFEKERAVILT